jgi:hypothetical protein
VALNFMHIGTNYLVGCFFIFPFLFCWRRYLIIKGITIEKLFYTYTQKGMKYVSILHICEIDMLMVYGC